METTWRHRYNPKCGEHAMWMDQRRTKWTPIYFIYIRKTKSSLCERGRGRGESILVMSCHIDLLDNQIETVEREQGFSKSGIKFGE